MTTMLFIVALAPAQAPIALHQFVLFRINPACSCIKTMHESSYINSSEQRVGKTLNQIFVSRTDEKRELFRVPIAWYKGADDNQGNKWWNYGIVDQIDLNGDGRLDYSWYGGDDTTAEMYIFLSSNYKYRRVDVLKTVESAWQNRFRSKSPDFREAGGKIHVSGVIFVETSSGLTLDVQVVSEGLGEFKKGTYEFDTPERSFIS